MVSTARRGASQEDGVGLQCQPPPPSMDPEEVQGTWGEWALTRQSCLLLGWSFPPACPRRHERTPGDTRSLGPSQMGRAWCRLHPLPAWTVTEASGCGPAGTGSGTPSPGASTRSSPWLLTQLFMSLLLNLHLFCIRRVTGWDTPTGPCPARHPGTHLWLQDRHRTRSWGT